jgi:hypothetical protein
MLLPLARGTIVTIALAFASPAIADDTVPVKVQLPFGMQASSISTTAARSDDTLKYVTIDSLLLANPSREQAQAYQPSQFHLLVGSRKYTPVTRPGLGALDLSQASVLSPGASQRVTLSFLVPAGTTAAKFEFIPHWQSDGGGQIDYCCYYL